MFRKILLAGAALCVSAPALAATQAIIVGNLVPDAATGPTGPAVILVEDGRIKNIAKGTTNTFQADTVVDLSTKTLVPGLIDLLPDPEVFTDAEPAYRAENWPTPGRPLQRWLDEARGAKALVHRSPLLATSTFIANDTLLTPQRLSADPHGRFRVDGPGPGDDTVPLRSAIPAGGKGWRATFPHALLPLDPLVLEGVPRLLAGDTPFGASRISGVPQATPSGTPLPPTSVPCPLGGADLALLWWLLSRAGRSPSRNGVDITLE
jgi:hypothetical protein